jgi:predicted acetyltransferase
MGHEIRPITADEFVAFTLAAETPFSHRPDEAEIEAWRAECVLDRTLAAFEDGRIVATDADLPFELTLPGGATLPVAGVTAVGVLPTHRRRGLLRELMRRELATVRERGEAAAVLLCSESVIYGRYGYGLATSEHQLELDSRHAAFLRPPEGAGRVRLIEHERALETLPAVYDRARREQPGAVSRSAAHWRAMLRYPAPPRDGAGPRFYVVYEAADGRVDGAAHYRVRQQWAEGNAGGTLVLGDLIAATEEAYAALWQFCLGVDLVRTVQAFNRPVDEPLRWMLADPRRLQTRALVDDLWVRLLDVPAALAARRYAAEGRLVLEVADPFRPEDAGRYALEGGPEGAECRPTTAEPDLALAADALGAAYLGGVRFATLARAGRVEERAAGALARADALFASERAPWCGTPF